MRTSVMRFSPVCLVVLAGVARGQCVQTWDTAIGTPGIGGGYAASIRGWNDGSGEKVYVGGSFTTAGGSGANQYLAAWDRSTGTWSALGSGISGGFTNAFMTALLPYSTRAGERLVA